VGATHEQTGKKEEERERERERRKEKRAHLGPTKE